MGLLLAQAGWCGNIEGVDELRFDDPGGIEFLVFAEAIANPSLEAGA